MVELKPSRFLIYDEEIQSDRREQLIVHESPEYLGRGGSPFLCYTERFVLALC